MPTLSSILPTHHLTLLSAPFFLALYALSKTWQSQVTAIVPTPYLDEVFHIPQAQAYCAGAWSVWDPKLTTPPGLYAFAVAFVKLVGGCDVGGLRAFNVWALILVMVFASDCRALLSSSSSKILKTGGLKAETLHTALNIALFPPLFFFSGLFYTDVLSTAVVLGMYKFYLERRGGVWLYGMGLIGLGMRQTNIFWVAVFMGGLEAVRCVKEGRSPGDLSEKGSQTKQEEALSVLEQWSRGDIHDVRLRDAGVHDFILCALSLATAILSKPLLSLTRLWPYIALLLSFASFVIWNGGVVLGDKSNHVATIHLPQMLYIWPFIAFFSAPLIVPSFLQTIFATFQAPRGALLTPVWKYALTAVYAVGALGVTLAVVRYNTIIHPFTLADNRHYIFYIFRYSILRHPSIRFLLAPIYLFCAYLVYLTLSGPSSPPHQSGKAGAAKKFETSKLETKKLEPQEGPKTSFLLILLATTALSLITAPLVEPRYFIIPWVLWRLHIPSTSPTPKAYDRRLFLETAWFVGINAVTGYIFLYRGFEWKQEPGMVQRFMW